jgi:hypothetical protein
MNAANVPNSAAVEHRRSPSPLGPLTKLSYTFSQSDSCPADADEDMSENPIAAQVTSALPVGETAIE